MKFLRRFLLIVLLVILFFFIALHLFVRIKGRDIIRKKMQATFNREVTIGKVTTSFPFNVVLERIDVKGLFTVKEAFAAGGLYDIFRKRYNLSLLDVVEPVVMVDRSFFTSAEVVTASGEAEPAGSSGEKETAINPLNVSEKSFLHPDFLIKRLVISDGLFVFTDKTAGEEGFVLTLKDLSLVANNVNVSSRGVERFALNLTGIVPWKDDSKADVSIKGWVEYLDKNMDVEAEFSHVDYLAFADYYNEKWKPPALGLTKGYFSVKTSLKANENDLDILWALSLDNVAYADIDTADKTPKMRMIKTILSALEGKTIRLKSRTKMDDPRVDLIALKNDFRQEIRLGFGALFGILADLTGDTVDKTAGQAAGTTVNTAVDAVSRAVKVLKKTSDVGAETTSEAVGTAVGAVKGVLDGVKEAFEKGKKEEKE